MVSFKTPLSGVVIFTYTLRTLWPITAAVTVSGGCANVQLGQASYSGSPTIPEKKWTQTPSVVHTDKSEYFYIMFLTRAKKSLSSAFISLSKQWKVGWKPKVKRNFVSKNSTITEIWNTCESEPWHEPFFNKERQPSTDFQQIPLIPDNYRVFGRVVHMNYVKEQLETEHSLTFAVTQEEVNRFNLDVFADVVYVEVRF